VWNSLKQKLNLSRNPERGARILAASNSQVTEFLMHGGHHKEVEPASLRLNPEIGKLLYFFNHPTLAISRENSYCSQRPGGIDRQASRHPVHEQNSNLFD